MGRQAASERERLTYRRIFGSTDTVGLIAPGYCRPLSPQEKTGIWDRVFFSPVI